VLARRARIQRRNIDLAVRGGRYDIDLKASAISSLI
jgi:hypothetical protein